MWIRDYCYRQDACTEYDCADVVHSRPHVRWSLGFFFIAPPPLFQNKWQDALVFILSFNSCPVSNITLIPFRDPSKQSIYQQGEKQQAQSEVCFSDDWPLIFHNLGLIYWELPMFKTSMYIFIFNHMPMNKYLVMWKTTNPGFKVQILSVSCG